MLVRDLIALLNEPHVTVESIAKPRIGVGDRRVRKALKEAGAVYVNRHGWKFQGVEANLDRPIHDFIRSESNTKASNSVIKATNNTSASNNASTKPVLEKVAASSDEAKTMFTNVSKSDIDKIDVLLGKNEAGKKDRVYRGFYFDKDIIEVIDGVKHGNKSDLVNEIVRLVLKDRGLL